MEYAVCAVAVAPVRAEPSHKTEMINQLLFGETMKVLEQNDFWFKIKGTYDGYEGWISNHMLSPIAKELAEQPTVWVTNAIIGSLSTPDGTVHLPMGASLTGFEETTGLLWNKEYKYEGAYRRVQQAFDTNVLVQLAYTWLNAPYLWGGRTLMGVDCSGFVQMVFKVLGISLLRDAYLQATQGEEVKSLETATIGDLAFFVNEAGRIIHVGIVLSDNKIIHASGKVRIDVLDEKGIINKDTQKRSHTLYSIRRYF